MDRKLIHRITNIGTGATLSGCSFWYFRHVAFFFIYYSIKRHFLDWFLENGVRLNGIFGKQEIVKREDDLKDIDDLMPFLYILNHSLTSNSPLPVYFLFFGETPNPVVGIGVHSTPVSHSHHPKANPGNFSLSIFTEEIGSRMVNFIFFVLVGCSRNISTCNTVKNSISVQRRTWRLTLLF